MYVFQPQKREGFKKLISVERAFTPEECVRITQLFSGGSFGSVTSGGAQVLELRKSKVFWIYFSEKDRWIFDRLENITRQVNDKAYGFQISGFYEALQLTRYDTGDHYTWHEDATEPGFTTRKLSLSLQLSPPEEYSGGGLVIFPGEEASKSQGALSFFPSFLTHKVVPVTHGTRFSLVAWATGEAFR